MKALWRYRIRGIGLLGFYLSYWWQSQPAKIGEVKRYTEDKLELIDFKVSREKFNTYKDKNNYLLGIKVNSNRNGGKCYGVIDLTIFRGAWSNNIAGLIFVGKHGGTCSGHDNANQLALNYISFFIKQVEDPQW